MDVLIVDDDGYVRELLASQCQVWGYETITACDGREAMALLEREDSPHLVIADWNMPIMDGAELCKMVKSQLKDGYYYFIMVTGKSGVEEKKEGFEAGVDDFLTKPTDIFELKVRLDVGKKIVQYDRELREREFQTRLQCYQALVNLAEKRDTETGAHIIRIGEYSKLLAETIGQSSEFCKKIKIFAPFHDIGKVGIPDAILLAPRKLTTEEFEIMKTHSTLGWQILQDVETMEMGAEIAISHHEKFNGSGYPHGLKGDDIPLTGRIVAIADVYDALRSKRLYKKAWTEQDVLNTMAAERGQHFDPQLIDAFLSINDKFSVIFEQNQ